MIKTNFDDYANNYNEIMQKQHKLFGNIDYYSFYKVSLVYKIVKSAIPSNKLNILEYGCGVGKNLPHLKNFFVNSKIFAYDISEKSLEIAKKNNLECHFTHDHEISSYKNFFDVIFIAGVYHHINPILRNTATQKIHTLIKNGGLAIIFEHNPYNPLTKHMVNTCEFDKDAILLTKKELISLFNSNDFHYVESKYCLFVPLILKKLNFLENLLFKIPLGGQHYSKK